MPPRRRKRSPVLEKGLAPGESLKRYLVPIRNTQSAFWSWVGSEVSRPADITQEHRLIACGFSEKNDNPFCANKYAISRTKLPQMLTGLQEPAKGDTAEDVIVISDEEEKCSKKFCKDNSNCLNYLGQDKWECEEDVLRDFLSAAALGHNPLQDSRDPELPVGLKNLGATCYANASLQVWFRNLAFRNGVYDCQPTEERGFKDSPLFQLQVTFAALQESSCSVFNPTSLVESLQLRTAEQQDAQEFSKLFISHLDAEFRKQSVPELRSLVSDQFQGTQVYGTICDTCQYRSERSTNFLEIEIRFEGNSNLEDCITRLLQEENLTGDNQYRCPQCDGLQDATRYTELRQLPPVLHFSLLRFVYDSSTMERRKSKYTVSFPRALDMSQFLKYGTQRDGDGDTYELQGILLHKGQSAYHGHYEAQVYDTERQSWFQFNDEIVTKIRTLGDKKPPSEADEESSSKLKKQPVKKKRRIVSDEEVELNQSKPPVSRMVSSKDAYMLIYVRKGHQNAKDQKASKLPQKALELVHTLNKTHEEDCSTYAHSEQAVKARFQSIREQVMNLYRGWNATSAADDSVILSQQWLRAWLSRDCINLAKASPDIDNARLETESRESLNEYPFFDDNILCIHKKLDPNKAKNMKRIKRVAYHKMAELTQYRDISWPSPQDVCNDCVVMEFKERLYNIEHPKLVKEFDEISEVKEGSLGYWISKKWLRDWRLLKPRMHKLSEDDPSPDSPGYGEDVRCEHGSLSLSSLNRRSISGEAVRLFNGLFPSWDPIRSDAEPCVVCDALAHISKEDKRESRRRADEEKALLKHMYEGTTFAGNEGAYTIVPINFYKGWLSWLNNPAENLRPNRVDNSTFLCEHELLVFDPNCPSDIEMTVNIIRRSDWEILEALYDSGPLISLRDAQDDGDGRLYKSDIPTCEACRLKRKTEWVSTDITVQLLRGKKSDTSTNRQPIVTYANRNNTRQSKRLREARENEKRRFAVTKMTTVKDIKVKIQEGFKIPTICQRLFFRGQELDDNETTVDSLEIFADEVLELREQAEVHEIDIDSDEGRPTKRQYREAERGFGGTLLSGGVSEHDPERDHSHSSRENGPHMCSTTLTEKVCSACTLVNAYDAVACTVCDTLFV